MTITIKTEDLAHGLAALAKAVDRKADIPILGHVLARSAGAGLAFMATDTDLTVTVQVDAEDADGVAVALPFATLEAIAKKIKTPSVSIDVAGESQVVIRGGRARFTVNTMPASDFPAFAHPETPHAFALMPHAVAGLLGTTAFAMSSEATRYYLQGVFLHIVGKHLVAVATDGHRLARAAIEAPEGALDIPGVILPKPFVAELARMAKDAEGASITLRVGERQVAAHVGKVEVVSKLIDGTYPDVARIIPASNPHTMKVDRTEWSDACERMLTVLADTKSRGIKHTLGDPETLSLSTRSETGSAIEDVAVDWDGPPGLVVGFNGAYVRDVCAVLPGDELDVALGEADVAPALITPIGEPVDGVNRLVVLMPLRVDP